MRHRRCYGLKDDRAGWRFCSSCKYILQGFTIPWLVGFISLRQQELPVCTSMISSGPFYMFIVYTQMTSRASLGADIGDDFFGGNPIELPPNLLNIIPSESLTRPPQQAQFSGPPPPLPPVLLC